MGEQLTAIFALLLLIVWVYLGIRADDDDAV